MLGRRWIGIDISENYCKVARQRIKDYQLEQQQLKINIEETTEVKNIFGTTTKIKGGIGA
jgi:DNA modification methylase